LLRQPDKRYQAVTQTGVGMLEKEVLNRMLLEHLAVMALAMTV
jgi:hypothetical protein